jgi:hypothetical protein
VRVRVRVRVRVCRGEWREFLGETNRIEMGLWFMVYGERDAHAPMVTFIPSLL